MSKNRKHVLESEDMVVLVDVFQIIIPRNEDLIRLDAD